MVDHWGQIAREIPNMRALAEAGMQDHVRVWRASTDEPTKGEWGEVIPAEPALVYEGRAKSQNDRTYPGSVNVGDVSRVVSMVSHVHFPHGTTEVRGNDVVEWVTSINPRLVGRKVRISVDQDKTWNTSARFNVAEVVA